jgi:hypothetical protein
MKFNTHRTTVTLLVGGILLPLACASTVAERLRETLFLERQVAGGRECMKTAWRPAPSICTNKMHEDFPNGTTAGDERPECIAQAISEAYMISGNWSGYRAPYAPPSRLFCPSGAWYSWDGFAWGQVDHVSDGTSFRCGTYVTNITGIKCYPPGK